MKKILAIFLLAGVTVALFPQAADQPKESQPIVVGGTEQGPVSTPVVRTITTKKGYSSTTTVPETVTTIVAPEKVLVREAALSWLSLGLRVSGDLHIKQNDATFSCLWLYGEIYNTSWGVEMGVGRLRQPITEIENRITGTRTAFSGEFGSRGYWTVDAIFKYYWWFARWLWAGAGLAVNMYDNGYLVTPSTTAAGVTTYSYQPVFEMRSLFLWQAGLGIKVALSNGFNAVHFDPNLRIYGPLNPDGTMNVMIRLNLGFTYSFGL